MTGRVASRYRRALHPRRPLAGIRPFTNAEKKAAPGGGCAAASLHLRLPRASGRDYSSVQSRPRVLNLQSQRSGLLVGSTPTAVLNLQSQRSGLNRRPLDYESSALPLSYAGDPLHALARTRTATPCGTTPSRWRVYQFHHQGPSPLRLQPTISYQRIGIPIPNFAFSCPTRERRGSNPRPLE